MVRKAQSDSDNEKSMKPKEQYRMIISVYDDPGVIDLDLVEFYLNEETGRRKKLMYDSPKKFRESIIKNLGENTDKLACWILNAMDIEPNAFARRICDLPESYEEEEYTEALSTMMDTEDAKEGEKLP